MNSVEARIDVVNQHLDPLHESVATGVAKVLEIAGVGILYGDHAAIFDMGKAIMHGRNLLLIGMPAVIQNQVHRPHGFEEVLPKIGV